MREVQDVDDLKIRSLVSHCREPVEQPDAEPVYQKLYKEIHLTPLIFSFNSNDPAVVRIMPTGFVTVIVTFLNLDLVLAPVHGLIM